MVDIVRARISAYLHDKRIGKFRQNELAVFQEIRQGAADPEPDRPRRLGTIGKIKDVSRALDWFKLSLEARQRRDDSHGLSAYAARTRRVVADGKWRLPGANAGQPHPVSSIFSSATSRSNSPYVQVEPGTPGAFTPG